MDLFSSDNCWVYILIDERSGEKKIIFCPEDDFKKRLEEKTHSTIRIVYNKKFNNIFDALAHKLRLQNFINLPRLSL